MPTLIDDLEDGDNAIITHHGRAGYWFSYHDGTANGSFSLSFLPDDGADDTARSVRFSAKNYTAYGAGFGITINGTNPACGHDASIYDGVRFWAKAVGRRGAFAVNLAIPTRDTAAVDPDGGGGTCVPGTAPSTGGGQSFPFSSRRLISFLFQTPAGDPVVVATGGGGGAGGDVGAAGAVGIGGAGSAELEYDHQVYLDQLEFFLLNSSLRPHHPRSGAVQRGSIEGLVSGDGWG